MRNLKNVALLTAFSVLSGCKGGVLDPKGLVGANEKLLIIISTVLMLLVVIPVIVLTLYFAWKYRASREHEVYMPKWAHSQKIEIVVWFIPIVIIAILGTITWQSTQALDPYKKLAHDKPPITIEVVSLNWKWLFIYPEQGIASVNEVAFPTDVPVEFKISSDATMNSFFIPQLGSQIYSMAGMTTRLNLIANEPGSYDGLSANYSGAGFTGMKFKAIATPTEADFDHWLEQARSNGQVLDSASYQALSEPSENNPVAYYSQVSDGLFQQVVMKYMHKSESMKHSHSEDHLAQNEVQVEE